MTDGESETVVSASLQKIKLIKNPVKHFFNFIKTETSDSFVNHFDGHFAYLKTLDFYFNSGFREPECSCSAPLTSHSPWNEVPIFTHTGDVLGKISYQVCLQYFVSVLVSVCIGLLHTSIAS